MLSWAQMETGFPGGSDGKESALNMGDLGLIPGWGRSPGEGNGNPLQYSCLGNPTIEELGRLQSMGSQRVGYDRARACVHTYTQLTEADLYQGTLFLH